MIESRQSGTVPTECFITSQRLLRYSRASSRRSGAYTYPQCRNCSENVASVLKHADIASVSSLQLTQIPIKKRPATTIRPLTFIREYANSTSLNCFILHTMQYVTNAVQVISNGELYFNLCWKIELSFAFYIFCNKCAHKYFSGNFELLDVTFLNHRQRPAECLCFGSTLEVIYLL